MAPFGRLPGYPIFWGLHYLLTKHSTYLAAAITQAVLDSLCVFLIYQILLRVSVNEKMALLGAMIYAGYIFSIVWVPVTGSESFGIFVSVLYLNCASRQQYSSKNWFVLTGLLGAVALYVREFLGIFFLFTLVYFIYLFIQKRIGFNRVVLYVLSFALLYGLWPLRNYVVYHRVEFLKPRNAGYPAFGKDFASFREWMYAWHTEVQPYLDRIRAGKDPEFPSTIFKNEGQHQQVNILVKKSMQCGTSFNAWNDKKPELPNCDNEISQQFDLLRSEFIKRKPFTFYVKIPALNISKAFFKGSLSNNTSIPTVFVKIAFAWRTLLVILGFAGLFFMPVSLTRFLIFCFSVFMYVYITCYIRQVEMRYLLQADVWLLIPAVVFVSNWVNSKNAKKQL